MKKILRNPLFRTIVVFVLMVTGGYYSGEYLMGGTMGNIDQPFMIKVMTGMLANSLFVMIFGLLLMFFNNSRKG